jgi:hypothetical protein
VNRAVDKDGDTIDFMYQKIVMNLQQKPFLLKQFYQAAALHENKYKLL